MIIFNVSGGLGNQLFQYAFGRQLAVSSRQDLYLFFESYSQDFNRLPRLDFFKTNYTQATSDNVKKYQQLYDRLPPGLKKIYRHYVPIPLLSYFNDKKDPKFQPRLLKVKRGYFDGYWSNENYFKNIRTTLQQEISIKQKYVTPEYQDFSNKVKNENSIAIHIRRGDYVSDEKFSKIFNTLPVKYYLDSIECITRQVDEPKFYVFSDDNAWARKNLSKKGIVLNFNECRSLQHDYIEFSMMRNCKHFIIANSTFSWWAAWLGSSSQKIVISPYHWYKHEGLQKLYLKESFVPKHWIKL